MPAVVVPASAPPGPQPPEDGFDAFVATVAEGVDATIKPQAAAAVATTFSFPLVLMLAVLIFLVVQSRLDSRDPKLRAASAAAKDKVLPFREEDHL